MNEKEEQWVVEGKHLKMTHLQKVYWPEDGLTKEDMLKYYREMAAIMLPYFRARPITLHFFPRGIHGPSFYKRDLPAHAPPWLRSLEYKALTTNKLIQLPLVDDPAGLLWLANLGAIEFHLWASRMPELQRPDMAIFDLDAGPKASFSQVLEVAGLLHNYLLQKGLKSYPKTSGGSGLHLYVPIRPVYTFETVRKWVKQVATEMAGRYPKLMVVPHGRTHRAALISIDYAQNSIGRNTAAPYTLRAWKGATVSAPLSWTEVFQAKLRPTDFTLGTMPTRVKKVGDLFIDILSLKQTLNLQ